MDTENIAKHVRVIRERRRPSSSDVKQYDDVIGYALW
jgi:hypothetical protein